MAITPPVNDPLFANQWYLQNTGQANGGIGVDLNVVPVWTDYTGEGVRIGITDDGVQLAHPDLAANVDIASSYDSFTNTQGNGAGNPVAADENHGTAVAGIIGADGNNGIGGTGVAYNSTLVAYRIPLHGIAPGNDFAGAYARAFQRQLTGNIDISSNSWGLSQAFGNDWNAAYANPVRDALIALGTSGRNNLGAVVVFAAGNGRVTADDVMLDNNLNNRFTIAVAALSNNGTATDYSTQGADILVSGFGGGNTPGQVATLPGNAMTTTDRTSTDGYNTTAGTDGNYTNDFNGTSAATPSVSGAIALMLQAAPNLGYRDVQNIIAYSARYNDNANYGWIDTAATTSNGGGLRYSREYGFGQMDARAAVRLAEVWAPSHGAGATEANLVTTVGTASSDPPPAGTPITPDTPVSIGFNFTQTTTIARMEIKLGLVALNPYALTITLVSPGKTSIPLVANPGNALDRSGLTLATPTAKAIAWPGTFTLDTPAFTGESLAGHWTLTVKTADAGATFNSASITAYGDTATYTPSQIFTDDFATLASRDPTRTTIGTAGTISHLNLAAVSSASTIDLSGAHKDTIAGLQVSVAPSAKFDQIYGGDGNDTIIGDGSGQLLDGGRGTNTLDGGTAQSGTTPGTSTALYLKSRTDFNITGSGADINNTIKVTDDTVDASVDNVTRVGKMEFIGDGTLYTPAATDQGINTAFYYQGLLGRTPDAQGYKGWTSANTDLTSIANGFLNSNEYQHGFSNLTNLQFVDQLYTNMLGRAADSGGETNWTNYLQQGASRATVASGFGMSPEYGATRMKPLFNTVSSLGNLWNI